METDMTKGKPLGLILRFAFPLLLGNIFQQLYNMADTIIVGQFVGENALAAVGSTGTIMFLVLGFSTGMATGFTILTSQKYGAGDIEATKYSVSNGILLSAVVIVFMTVISLLTMRPLLQLMNTPADIFEDAYSYISVICIGIFASVYYNLFSSFLRAVGNSKVPLFFLILSALLNVGLDLLFVVTFRMGVAGAAWATDLSQAISAVLCLVYIFKKVPVLTPDKNQWHLNRRYTKHQLSIGLPMALQFAITAVGTIIMQAAINIFGSTAVAGFTAASKVNNLLAQGFMAIGQTIASYSGQNFGRLDIKRIRRGTTDSMKITVIYSLIAAVIGILCLPVLMQFFFPANTDMASLMPWARTYMYESVAFYIPLSMIFIYRNAMQGCGYSLPAMMLGFMELAARLVTAFLSMALHSYFLAAGCDAAAWLTTGIFSLFLYLSCMKKTDRMVQKRGEAAGPASETP